LLSCFCAEIRLWEFKPSMIAASALLCASHELFPFQYPSFLKAITESTYVNKVHITHSSFIIIIMNCFGGEERESGKVYFECWTKLIEGTKNLLQESVEQCYKVIQDIAIEEEYESALNGVSRSDTPINVLDHHFLSSESEKTNGITVADSPLRQERDLKRRKITPCGNNPTIHNSWIN